MGVSKNRGTPKWMVYFMENPIKMVQHPYNYIEDSQNFQHFTLVEYPQLSNFGATLGAQNLPKKSEM